MSRATLHCGDVRAVLADIPAESVQMVCTSPPYWGLRDYGVPGQLGLERTPEEYVANMVAVFREVRRVLRNDGCVWLNLGDSYAANRAYQVRDNKHTEVGNNMAASVPVGLKPKDLVGIPWRTAFALQADGWWLRSDVIWAKPNPMPESVTDRPTRSHEYLFLLTKSATYWYDAQAIAEPASDLSRAGQDVGRWGNADKPSRASAMGRSESGNEASGKHWVMGTTRNARSVWTIATMPYPQAHFATFPEELAKRCILAGSSPRACEHCGAPWERITERPTPPGVDARDKRMPDTGYERSRKVGQAYQNWLDANPAQTVGWQPTCSCECAGTGRSIVLDPFAGSGTVAQVATGNGRDSIYIDLNPKYLELARQRIGPMFCGEAA